jgi:hypothetical protein
VRRVSIAQSRISKVKRGKELGCAPPPDPGTGMLPVALSGEYTLSISESPALEAQVTLQKLFLRPLTPTEGLESIEHEVNKTNLSPREKNSSLKAALMLKYAHHARTNPKPGLFSAMGDADESSALLKSPAQTGG